MVRVDGLVEPHDMNAWAVDASNLPGQDNGAFNPSTIDPSAAFLHASPNPQDPNQFQRMFNGVPRNASPGFHNPGQVIPSKRPRPEDGMPMSPRPAPGGVPGSRSQTPQVPYPGYQGPANGTPQYPQHPTPYQHLQQNASPNVTQSPVMQDFDQQSVRMGTASPSPFSPAGPHVGPHMSPPQSDHGSRVNTPQNANFMPGQAFPQGMNPQFQQGPGMTSAGPQQSMQAQLSGMQQGGMQQVPPGYHQAIASQQQRLHAMNMQNRQMNSHPQMGARPPAGMNPMANPQQMAAIRQMQQNMAKPTDPAGFMRTLQKFMMQRNLPFDTNPIICGRPINPVQLYGTVMKMGGSKKVTAMNAWPAVGQHLQFPQMQFQSAAQELRDYHQRNLALYEQAYITSQQRQFAEQMQQQQQHQQQPQQQQQQQQQQQPPPPPQQQPQPQPQGGMPRQPNDPSAMQLQSPALKPGHGFDQSQQISHSSQNHTPIPNHAQATPVNGFTTPTQARSQSKPPTGHRSSISRQVPPPTPPVNAVQFATPTAAQQQPKAASATPVPQPAQAEHKLEQVTKVPIEDTFKPTVITEHHLHGPIVVDEMYQLGEHISRLKPFMPSFAELGVVDIHALNMGLKSGIQAEIRVALDTLTTLSCEPTVPISLENCDDLVESLVDCAQDQVDFLVDHIPEVSEIVHLRSYEEVTRGCQTEFTSLAEVPEFGSVEYYLDRAVERLICITTIFRNFSFSETNLGILGMPDVTQVYADIFRSMGMRKMFLRTDQNTLDFMKDAVIFMSNLAHVMQIPGKEEALSLLNFLLAFAPTPEPTSNPDKLMFTTLNPSVHRYTPAAVDGLAKMLARDDPNRIYLGTIFSGDGSVPPRPDLLTRAFGLAICAIPDKKTLVVADARKVLLMHGLLAADVLSTFADGSMARSWLASVDGFAIHLLNLSCLLCNERLPHLTNPRQRGGHPSANDADAYAFSSIIHRGLAILRRLAEKSKQVDNISPIKLPSGVIPSKESLLGALLLTNMDPTIIRHLLAYARLAE
ncbi:hypothetical protein N7478_003285 [Penicillium angulare]|uniref:uncharacterized protein n=1 Tax=Penicillium angulare TaxID=116970 RepID=UPI002540B63D|nr:uncharacterized protein N7478_003285 [Penicillium angulare]KAJ5287599.1 hypothetical protein N7478_003285 [Penicillium angulare]